MLNYIIHNTGDKKWVVFIHGIGGNTLTWNNQIEDFKQKYNLLLINLPWHGDSKIKDKISKNVISEEIKNVLDKEKIETAHFIGTSLGSLVVSQFTIKYPKYVDKIILASSAVKINLLCKIIVIVAQPIRFFLPYKLIYHLAVALLAPQHITNVDKKLFIDGFEKIGRSKMIEWIKYLTVMLDGDNVIEKLKKTKKEILLISGEYDKLFIGSAKKSANMLNTKIEIIPKSTHICNNDNYKQFNQKALRFLAD